MAGVAYKGKVVFGLDIGTRSVVGTVGYRDKERFVVIAQKAREHESRAMLDGQIHDIKKVSGTIAAVKEELEQEIGFGLEEVCIAAAGRVLRTVTTHVDYKFEVEKTVLEEDVYALSAMGVEKAYEEFLPSNDTGMKFYCVGYSVIRYYMNGYPIGNPEEHNAAEIGADMIVTFLPEDVVDGLYKAVEHAGLQVANLTLEPIAAIQVAIPERFRLLNIALVDVGAGTSDISITKSGAIVAYGMIPLAGDSLTEVIADRCLVDFNTAEQIKRSIEGGGEIPYTDIMGLQQTVKAKDLLDMLQPDIDNMAEQAAACIRELNGDKSVSAVFVVGGGGKIPGYTQALAEKLDVLKERVAVRGEDVMGFVDFPNYVKKDSLLVTPVGICLCFYEHNNNFVFVTFNGERIKIYDNGNLTVVDVAMQAEFPNDELFPKRGKELNFTVDGKVRMKRGELGEAAVITVNGDTADIHSPVKANDVIVVQPSTAGEAAVMEVRNLPEYRQSITVMVNEKKVVLPKFVNVNGELQSEYYSIAEGDRIEMQAYYPAGQVLAFMDITLPEGAQLLVNNAPAGEQTPVYENFSVTWREGSWEDMSNSYEDEEEPDTPTAQEPAEPEALKKPDEQKKPAAPAAPSRPVHPITVTVNGSPVTLNGKGTYVYVDIFDYIDFDLTKPHGNNGISTSLNGSPAEYLKEIVDGDVIDVHWRD